MFHELQQIQIPPVAIRFALPESEAKGIEHKGK
jgi:hypothetical protein